MEKRIVLIVEDSESVMQTTSAVLNSRGFETFPVLLKERFEKNLENLVRKVRGITPERIILDGLNGDCFRYIDSLKEEFPEIEYVIFSGDTDLTNKAKEMGYPAFSKPGLGKLSEYLEN